MAHELETLANGPEYLDHYAKAATVEVRARRTVTGTGADLKARAFDLLAV